MICALFLATGDQPAGVGHGYNERWVKLDWLEQRICLHSSDRLELF